MYQFSARAVLRQILPRIKKGALQMKDSRHIFKDFKRLSAVLITLLSHRPLVQLQPDQLLLHSGHQPALQLAI